MADRIAIKRLTASDCTLFEAVFRTIGAGNQKSINLNADVLTGQLYPSLSTVAAASDNEIALPISIYGPAAKGAHKLSRKIIKNESYKNWRLDGEFISGPPDDTSRYDAIQPGDLVVMAFKGETSPNAMDLIIVSQANPPDAGLHAALSSLFTNKSMIAASAAQIANVAAAAATPGAHPIYVVASDVEMDGALEDAAQGGIEGTEKLLRNSAKKLSSSDLAKAKAKAELIGRDGEGLVNGYLAIKLAAGQLDDYVWKSDENAIAPYDFETFVTRGAQRTLIDVKATGGPFENIIHLSLAEVIEASRAVPYCIYRVFDLNEDGGMLRISDDIRPLAQSLKKIHESQMPAGIRVDSFSVSTTVLQWGVAEYIARVDEDDA